jgi:hypothetical protein
MRPQNTDADDCPSCWGCPVALREPLCFDADASPREQCRVAKSCSQEELHVSIALSIVSIAVRGTPNA